MSRNIFLFTKYIILMINPLIYVYGGNINTNNGGNNVHIGNNFNSSVSVIKDENGFILNENTDVNLQDEKGNNVSAELSLLNDVDNKDLKENDKNLLDILEIFDNNGDEFFKNIDSHEKKNLLNNMNEDNDSKLNWLNGNPSYPPQKSNNVSFGVKNKNCCNCSACC